MNGGKEGLEKVSPSEGRGLALCARPSLSTSAFFAQKASSLETSIASSSAMSTFRSLRSVKDIRRRLTRQGFLASNSRQGFLASYVGNRSAEFDPRPSGEGLWLGAAKGVGVCQTEKPLQEDNENGKASPSLRDEILQSEPALASSVPSSPAEGETLKDRLKTDENASETQQQTAGASLQALLEAVAATSISVEELLRRQVSPDNVLKIAKIRRQAQREGEHRSAVARLSGVYAAALVRVSEAAEKMSTASAYLRQRIREKRVSVAETLRRWSEAKEGQGERPSEGADGTQTSDGREPCAVWMDAETAPLSAFAFWIVAATLASGLFFFLGKEAERAEQGHFSLN